MPLVPSQVTDITGWVTRGGLGPSTKTKLRSGDMRALGLECVLLCACWQGCVYLSPSPPLPRRPDQAFVPNPCHPHPATQWPLPSLGWGSQKSWSCQIHRQRESPGAIP